MAYSWPKALPSTTARRRLQYTIALHTNVLLLVAAHSKDDIVVVHISTTFQSECPQATAGRPLLVNTHIEHLKAPTAVQHFLTLQPSAPKSPSLLLIARKI